MNFRRLGFSMASLGLVFITGCGVTLSPVKRKPLEIAPLQTTMTASPQIIRVVFERTLPGTPLAETVWDNHVGAFADAKESVRIGYTQDYTQPVLHGPVAMTEPSYTHLFIPFGRIFEGVFTSGLQKAFPQAPAASETMDEAAGKENLVRLKVVEFQVWEQPLNHINMNATVECHWSLSGATNQTDAVYVAHHEIINQSLGTLPTSGSVVKKLEVFANGMAATLSEDILEHLHQRSGNWHQP